MVAKAYYRRYSSTATIDRDSCSDMITSHPYSVSIPYAPFDAAIMYVGFLSKKVERFRFSL